MRTIMPIDSKLNASFIDTETMHASKPDIVEKTIRERVLFIIFFKTIFSKTFG